MPDITMCQGHNCPKKENCYRHTAKPSQWQSYFSDAPWNGTSCEHYWPNEERNSEAQTDTSA